MEISMQQKPLIFDRVRVIFSNGAGIGRSFPPFERIRQISRHGKPSGEAAKKARLAIGDLPR